jgi:hypothetical protein
MNMNNPENPILAIAIALLLPALWAPVLANQGGGAQHSAPAHSMNHSPAPHPMNQGASAHGGYAPHEAMHGAEHHEMMHGAEHHEMMHGAEHHEHGFEHHGDEHHEHGFEHRGEARFHDRDPRHFSREEIAVWRGGYWHHGWHDGRFGWWWGVGGAWYYYPQPAYPYPVLVPLVIVGG